MSTAVAAPGSAPAAPGRFSWLLMAAAAMLALTAFGSIFLWNYAHYWLMHTIAVQTLLYAGAAWIVTRPGSANLARTRTALLLILAAAAAMRAVIIMAPPVSTDIYRYIWDGRTQSHVINPYKYIPADPALEGQRGTLVCPEDKRDDWTKSIHPDRGWDAWSTLVCKTINPGAWTTVYQRINRADWLKTPYPPMAQIVFLIATRFGESVPVMKSAMVVFECLTIICLLRMMARRGLPPARILLYAWNPLVVWEVAGSGHTEAIGIGFMMLSMVAADSGKRFLSGIAMGAAALSKFFPLACAPAVYRRWDWRMPAGLVLAVALLYVPYIGAGLGAFGSVGDYAHEVGADTGKAFFLLDWLGQFVALGPLTQKIYLGVAAALLCLAGMVVVMRRDSAHAAPVAAMVLVTMFQVVMSPHYPWYLTWAVPFLCFRMSFAVIWLTGTASLLYEFFTPLGPWLYAVVWGPFLVLALLDLILAWRKPGRSLLPACGETVARSAG